MRWSFVPLVIVALALVIYGSRQGSTATDGSLDSIQQTTPSKAESGQETQPTLIQPIVLSLSLYVVHQAPPGASSDDSSTSQLSSVRTEAELTALADQIQEIWLSAGIIFDPVIVRTIEIPASIALSLQDLDSLPFFQAAGQAFDVPDTGNINGFYVGSLGPVNGFAPTSSNVFFVTDEPSVHDERVSSHEIGHILGLGHTRDDSDRLMFSGTNGMTLTDSEIETARAGARVFDNSPAPVPASGGSGAEIVRIDNQGGSMEGHTPRGFAGSGVGLFVGDNLNPNFPDGDGVQVFLTFDLPDDLDPPSQVLLTSDALEVGGTPFADLGPLLTEPVSYDDFGPHLFDLAPDGSAVECERPAEHVITCDVTDSVVASMANGESSAQFRLYFERVADLDQSQDLAKFFRTDSNTNEAGLFVLEMQR